MELYITEERVNKANSIFLILSIYIDILIYPILMVTGNTLILWILLSGMLITSIYINRKINIKLILFLLAILIMFFMNYLLVDYRHLVIVDFINFLRAGLITLYFTSQINDYEDLIKWWYRVALISILVCNYMLPYFMENNMYMDFGIFITYSFIIIALCFYNKYNKNTTLNLILMIFLFLEICLFANRGSIIISLLVVLYYEVLNLKQSTNYKIIFKLTIISFIGSYLIFHMEKILDKIISILNYYNINSYAITKIVLTLQHGVINESSGRDKIVDICMDIARNSGYMPNGIGYFTYVTNGKYIYPHNIILEILITFGIIGVVIFLGYVINMIIKYNTYKKYNEYFKNITIVIFIYTIVRLMLSSTFWKEKMFWLIIGIIMFINKRDIVTGNNDSKE